jgi:hypothetical protein
MALPRPVRVYVRDAERAKAFQWALDLQAALGTDSLQVKVVGD